MQDKYLHLIHRFTDSPFFLSNDGTEMLPAYTLHGCQYFTFTKKSNFISSNRFKLILMKWLFLVALPLLLLLPACKKESSKTAPAVIKSISQLPSGYNSNFSYDEYGRLTLQSNNDGTKTSIAYAGDTITETTYLTTGDVSDVKIMTTDSFGLAISYIRLDHAGAVTGFGQYTYDGAGHRIGELIFDSGMNQTQRKEWSYDNAGDINGYKVYDTIIPENNEEYYYDKYYISQTNTTGNANKGQSYYGNGSHHLIKAMHRLNYLLGNVIYSYTYTFDEYGRTITETAQDHTGKQKYVNTYTYN